MDEAKQDPAPEPGQRRPDYEGEHITRSEYIAAIVHLYRGELFRANSWRMRLDTTTNWAILTTAGLLSFTFGGPGHTHWVLLTGIPLISALLGFEARRFRFFDVWRYRVRKIEENFYGPILRRDPVSPDEIWGDKVAEDLLQPSFHIGYRAALRARFIRNYWIIYFVLITSWGLKVVLDPVPAHSWADLKANLGSGALPWWLPLCIMGTVLAFVAVMVLWFPRADSGEESYWSSPPPGRELPAIDT